MVKGLNGGEVSILNLNGNLLILSILWNIKDVYGITRPATMLK